MSHMHSPYSFSFFLISILLVVYNLNCEARDSINVRNPLSDSGGTLVSAGNRFELGFFTPEGNEKSIRYIGIWYYKLIPRTIVWVANRDTPLHDSCGFFGIAEDGNVKVWCNKGEIVPITSLENSRTSNRTLQLWDSGNLILADGLSGTRLWQSFDYPTDTFLPGMKMNDNVELTSWISQSDPGMGNYTFLQDQGVHIIQKRSAVYWKSGEPGTFTINDGLPVFVDHMLSNSDTGLDQQNYQPLVSKTSNRSISFPNHTRAFYYNNSRLVMNSSGEIQYYSLVAGGSSSLLWSEPQNPCSVYDACGKFGICNLKYEPLCQCPRGFKPASLEEWSAGQYSEGCDRKSTICSPKDTFLNLALMKVGGQVTPFDRAQKEEECKEECLNNCKCVAYLYRNVNIRDRETGKSAPKCGIWTTDLVNLRHEYNDGAFNLSLRVPFSATDSTTRICQPCVTISIPYPLSIGPDCGDPSYYSFYCNSSTGEISFLALSGKYHVTGIDKEKRRFVILVDSESADTCNARNLSSQVLKLNHSLPFTVTNWCYSDPGTSSPQPEVRVGNQIEIGWEPPLEPTCNSSIDCKDWPNSDCHDNGNGQRRCYCNQSYQWDDSSANCTEDLGKDSEAPKKKSQTRYVIAFTVLVAGVILFSCSSYILCRRRRMAKRLGNRGSTEASPVPFSYESERQVNDLMRENDKRIDVPFYNLDTILSATDNFSNANKLGQGGFGPVYKGKFPGGGEIAVKRLSSCSSQGIEEFLNEVVLIAKLQHRNLVRLLGYCIKENEKILLYEYMPNRSLDAFIFDQHNSLLLDWKKRFDIILGIARGLLYLHQDSRLRIIHRDLKTSNILLDEDMNPKISDFGLARIVEGKGTEASTNKVVGTYGYMSPEYALDGKFSIKSDVFSFGVVMLEIISGKKNTGFYNPQEVLNLLGFAWRLWNENKALDLVDPTLLESCENSQVMKCINIGLLCVQEDPIDRPSMSTVVIMLGSEMTPLPLPTQPAFVVRRRLSGTSSSSSRKPDSISNNELTISMAEAR